MLVVAALGGNALVRRGDAPDVATQRRNVRAAAAALAPIARDHRLVVTHGNGPQVGLLALEAAAGPVTPPPLDVLDAETEGLIGYLVASELANALPDREVVSVLTRVVVDAHDPAFSVPTKPIGPRYSRAEAMAGAEDHGWSIAEETADDGRVTWQRVVASPAPQRVVELHAIETLIAAGIVPICLGGGGIPVTFTSGVGWSGVEAVVDKDASSALLARELRADRLLLLTDVDGVYEGFGTPGAQRIDRVSAAELGAGEFAAGSMGPKVAAACAFVQATLGTAVIGALTDAARMVDGTGGGTVVTPGVARRRGGGPPLPVTESRPGAPGGAR